MERAVIYARCGKGKQAESSIDFQISECYEFAIQNEYNVVGEYTDRGFSGNDENRPNFQRMVSDGFRNQFDVIIVHQINRFTRNICCHMHYKNLFEKNDVRIISACENINNVASGIMMEAFLEGIAEYYSVELRQKVKRS